MVDPIPDDSRSAALTLARQALQDLREQAPAGRDPDIQRWPEWQALEGKTTAAPAHPLLAALGLVLHDDLDLAIDSSLSDPTDLDDAAIALTTALFSRASRSRPESHWFHYWTSETLRAALPRFGLTGPAGRIRREIEERITLGINLRGRPDEQFLAAVRHVDEHDALPHESAALAVLRVVLQTVSFCGSDYPRILRLGLVTPGQPATQALVLGLLHGAYYGSARLEQLWPDLAPDPTKRGRT